MRELIRSCVVKKKDEFGQMRSTDDFWHYKKASMARGARFVLHYL